MARSKLKERLDLFEGIEPPKDVSVVLWNDETTPIDFVILIVLVSIFSMEIIGAVNKAKEAEANESTIICQCPRNIAEIKIKKAISMARRKGYKDFKMTIKEE